MIGSAIVNMTCSGTGVGPGVNNLFFMVAAFVSIFFRGRMNELIMTSRKSTAIAVENQEMLVYEEMSNAVSRKLRMLKYLVR